MQQSVPSLPLILLYTLIPMAAAALAGAIAARWPPSPPWESGIQHFAAGVIFAAAAIELLPDLLKHSPIPTLLGFAIGIVAMFALRWLSERIERRGKGGATGLIAATAVDFLVDGLVLGAGFAVGGHTGLLLTIALAIEYLFVGISVAAALGGASFSKKVAVPSVSALLTVAGAVGGALILGAVPAIVLPTVLAVGAVAFMYLVTEELLVRAHKHGETAQGSILFFIGFLIYLIIEEVV